MSNKVLSYSIRALLTDVNRYLVPMYQRNYAWGESEINQLVQDVFDYQQKSQSIDQKQTYYIGTLVTFERNDGSFEVIDGQQRFTSLTLLAFALKRLASQNNAVDMSWYSRANLDFENRVKSSETFACLIRGVDLKHLKTDEYNLDVINGYELLEKALLALGDKLSEFCDYLFNHVQIARVSVPKDTDLNHYFEVMNNRGEQLEKHEIVKARLMSVLNDEEDKNLLSRIWDATANMERYVQYGFTTAERHYLFGNEDWGQFTLSNFTDLVHCINKATNKENQVKVDVSRSLHDMLIDPPESLNNIEVTLTPERFNSVINFSNFLLHVLRVATKKDVPLDDKQLLEQFDNYLKDNEHDPITCVKEFIFALLKCKYLFDQYVIKREFSQGGDKWSLKRLHFYNSKSQSYINTFDKDSEDGFEGVNRKILMLQSALHVSNPTLVYKHWLNGALYNLYYMENITPQIYLQKLENLARQFVFGRFLCDEGADYYDMIYRGHNFPSLDISSISVKRLLQYSVIENNLIFNYLDYLLWCEGVNNFASDVITQFEFTFRSSVEHFYPQHPLDGHRQLDSTNLHSFGNLCLISHSKNSKLSNLQPTAKRDHFKAAITEKKIDTLKLYEMIKLMDETGNWSEAQIKEHEKTMLTVLINDSKGGGH